MDNSVIVLYHRAPYEEILKDGTVSYRTHGKPNGIIPLLKHYFLIRGRGVWIAASSLITEHNLPVRDELPIDETEKIIILRKVPVSRAETNEFYHKSSKEGFWPVLHSFPEKFNFSSINWEQFLMINQRFAAAA